MRVKTRSELPWLYYPEFDRVIINAHNFPNVMFSVNGKIPVAVWCPSRDDAGNGTATLYDLVGSTNGTLTLMDPATDWVADTTAGGIRALDLDGVNDHILSSSPLVITSASFSVSLWLRRIATAGFPRIIDIGDGANTFQIVIDEGSGGTNQLNTKHTQWQTGINATRWGYQVAASTWEHILVCVNASTSTASLYRNGALQTGSASANVGSAASGNSVYLGARRDLIVVTQFHGRLDDVRLFDEFLDSSDAAYLYNSGSGRGLL